MRFILFTSIIALVFACQQGTSERLKSKYLKVSGKVNFDRDVSEIYEKVSSVKLKIAGREYLESIDKIELRNNKLFVLNRFGSYAGLYAFSAVTGDFLGKYGEQGGGIGSYDIPYDFLIDQDKIELLTNGKIVVFDLESFEYMANKFVEFAAVRFMKKNGNYFYTRGGDEPYFTFFDSKEQKEYSYLKEYQPLHASNAFNPIITGYSKNFVQLNYNNQLYEIADDNTLQKSYLVKFDGKAIDQKYINSLPSPSAIRKKVASAKIIKEFFFELKDYLYFFYVYDGKEHVKIIAKKSHKELTFNVTKVSNSLTNEKYTPFIINQQGDQLISIKSLENDQSELHHDYEVFVLKVKEDLFE